MIRRLIKIDLPQAVVIIALQRVLVHQSIVLGFSGCSLAFPAANFDKMDSIRTALDGHVVVVGFGSRTPIEMNLGGVFAGLKVEELDGEGAGAVGAIGGGAWGTCGAIGSIE